jgi:hypothetical protein
MASSTHGVACCKQPAPARTTLIGDRRAFVRDLDIVDLGVFEHRRRLLENAVQVGLADGRVCQPVLRVLQYVDNVLLCLVPRYMG